MEKRAILFLILSLIILMLYPYLLQKLGFTGPEPPKETPIKERPDQAKPARPLPSTTIKTPVKMKPGAGIEKDLTIETDLYRAVLTTRGAAIVRWELKGYKEDASLGQAIQLYRAATDSLPPLSILTGDQRLDEELREAIYQVEGEDLALGAGRPSGTISLFYLNPEKRYTVLKRITFHNGRYEAEVEIEITGAASPYQVHLGTNFGITDWGAMGFIGFIGPISLAGDTLFKDSPGKMEDAVRHEGAPAWVALQDKYFIAALIPSQGSAAVVRKQHDQAVTAGVEFSTGSPQRAKLYAGPKEFDRLSGLNVSLEKTIDFGWFIFGSWSLVGAIAKPLFHILRFFYHYTHNYGVAIILLTIGVRALFIPLAHKSYKSMKAMQALQPEIAAVQKKYKEDRERMNREMMGLYKKHGANPLGGCLPVILQIPVFIALFNVLSVTIELRQAPFVLWVKDLSIKDPYYVLPILMGITMLIQQKMQPSTMDPAQARLFLFLPVIFTFMFLQFPSGLVLYWLTNNVLTILQQYVTMKYLEKPAHS